MHRFLKESRVIKHWGSFSGRSWDFWGQITPMSFWDGVYKLYPAIIFIFQRHDQEDLLSHPFQPSFPTLSLLLWRARSCQCVWDVLIALDWGSPPCPTSWSQTPFVRAKFLGLSSRDMNKGKYMHLTQNTLVGQKLGSKWLHIHWGLFSNRYSDQTCLALRGSEFNFPWWSYLWLIVQCDS